VSRLGSGLGRLLPFLYAFAAILAAWLFVLGVFRPHVSLLPPPALVAREFWALAVTGELFKHIWASLSRVFSAWCLAGLIAIPLGLAMGRIPRFERIVDPLVELIRPISPLAWIPLAILWFGIGEFGKVFVVLVGTFFPTLISTVAGVKRIDPVLIQAGQVLGCTDRASLFRKVVLPAALSSCREAASFNVRCRTLASGRAAPGRKRRRAGHFTYALVRQRHWHLRRLNAATSVASSSKNSVSRMRFATKR